MYNMSVLKKFSGNPDTKSVQEQGRDAKEGETGYIGGGTGKKNVCRKENGGGEEAAHERPRIYTCCTNRKWRAPSCLHNSKCHQS